MTRASKAASREQLISLTADGAATCDEIAPQRKRARGRLFNCFRRLGGGSVYGLDRQEEHLDEDS
jgi:hypothetical protein